MISELKIELNDRIISNESNVNYSHIINHLLENGKNDDLTYRNMDIHTDVVKYNDSKKDEFLTKNGDTMRVVCNVFLKDISNFFKNLHIPLMFSQFNLTLKLIDQIYVTDQANTSQSLVSANLYVNQVVLHEMEKIQFVKNHNDFDANIYFLENFVNKDSQSIMDGEFNVSAKNCTNSNDVFLMLVKDDVVTDNAHTNTLRLPNKES